MTQSCQINLFSSDCSLPPEELGQGECAHSPCDEMLRRAVRQQNQTVLVPSLLSVQLIHPKQVDRGHCEVRIIEDLPLKDCVTKVTKLVDNCSDIVDVEESKLSTTRLKHMALLEVRE